MDSVPIASVGSPTSAAPSPNVTSSVPPPDPTMPTLSPQPPPPQQSPLDDNKVVSTPIDFNAPKSVSSISNQVCMNFVDVGWTVRSSGVRGIAGRCIGGIPYAPNARRKEMQCPVIVFNDFPFIIHVKRK